MCGGDGNELLQAFAGVHLAGVDVSLRVNGNLMDPVKRSVNVAADWAVDASRGLDSDWVYRLSHSVEKHDGVVQPARRDWSVVGPGSIDVPGLRGPPLRLRSGQALSLRDKGG